MSCAVNSIATSTVAIASAEEREGEIVVMNLRSAENAGATELNLNYCYLSSLPHALAESHYCRDNLQKLYLKGNIICQMPCSVLKRMGNLKELYLHSNSLKHLPSELSELKSLETLNVACNQLTALPASVGKMTCLRRIDLTHNKVSDLPDEMWEVPNLEQVMAARNELSVLSPAILSCQSLHTLVLDKNRLTELPLQLTQLLNLSYLSVCGNKLTTLPSDFSALSKLKVVYADGNPRLYSIPASLAGIKSLGVQGCNVSFVSHVMVGGEEGQGEKGGSGVLRIRTPTELVPSLTELAAKALHDSLRRVSPQLPWSLPSLFPFMPTSLSPWLVPRGRCVSPGCPQPVFFSHHYRYLVSGLTFQSLATMPEARRRRCDRLPSDASVSLDFCSLRCARSVLSLQKTH